MKAILLTILYALMIISAPTLAAPKLHIQSGDQSLTLDRSELEAFPQTTVTTKSPYFDGEVEFSGPTLKRIVENFGLTGETQLTFRALNDYQVRGNVKEVMNLSAIIATRMNSKPMSVRDRGPFWVILPLSDRPELDDENYHRYMIWQLNEIQLK